MCTALQALRSEDKALLERCLTVGNADVIRNTVARLQVGARHEGKNIWKMFHTPACSLVFCRRDFKHSLVQAMMSGLAVHRDVFPNAEIVLDAAQGSGCGHVPEGERGAAADAASAGAAADFLAAGAGAGARRLLHCGPRCVKVLEMPIKA